MKQLTLRGFGKELERRIRELARREGISLNQAALRLLRRGAGLGDPGERAHQVGPALDALIGTWSDAEAAAFAEAVEDLEHVDDSLWR